MKATSKQIQKCVTVFPKNQLRNDGIGYTAIIAQYDSSGKLLSCKTLNSKTVAYSDYSGAVVDCGKMSFVERVKSEKAFYSHLVSYTKAAEEHLTVSVFIM